MVLPGLAAIDTDAVPLDVIVKVIALEVAVVVDRHDALDVSTQVIASLLARLLVLYVDDVAPPIAVPFLYHWYVGPAPPLVGVAVKVTLWPAQMEFPLPDTILTAGVIVAPVVMVIELDVAIDVVTQLALEVSTQVIASPLTSVVVM